MAARSTRLCSALVFLALLVSCGDSPPPADFCPDDPDKVEAGTCGCGVSDADTNENGAPDCLDAGLDLCPDDPDKTQAGTCGCGVSDADANENGAPDCLDAGLDLCPDDPDKTQAGACGCGTSDVSDDGDPVPDCLQRTLQLVHLSEFVRAPGNGLIGGTAVLLNHTGVPVDLATAAIRDIVVSPPSFDVTVSAPSPSGILASGERTNNLSQAMRMLMTDAGLLTDPASTTASVNMSIGIPAAVVGDYEVSYVFEVAGCAIPVSLTVHIEAGTDSELLAVHRAFSGVCVP